MNATILKTAAAGATAALLALSAQGASAATITFDNFVTTTDNNDPFPTPVVTVDDDTIGFLTFSIGTDGVIGKLSGVFFDVSGVLISLADIVNESIAIAGFGNDTNDLGNGVNLSGGFTNGTNSPVFDFGIRIAQTDVSTTPFTFQISTTSTTLDLSDIEGVGLRFQSVGAYGEGSAKVIGFVSEPPPPPPIPLPAGGVLLVSALAGLALAKRRRAAD